MLLQCYSMQASPSLLTVEVRVMFFEFCVHDGKAPIRRAMLSGDISCCDFLFASLDDKTPLIEDLLLK